nr:unnamed protein product [Callosobruchus chinensis]
MAIIIGTRADYDSEFLRQERRGLRTSEQSSWEYPLCDQDIIPKYLVCEVNSQQRCRALEEHKCRPLADRRRFDEILRYF